MSSDQFRDALGKAFKESSKQLKEGNFRGYSIIDQTLHSLITLTDDEEIVFMSSIVGCISIGFLEEQNKIEKGEEFIKELGAMLESIWTAYESNKTVELNKNYRKFIVFLHKRWKESGRMKEIRKE